MFVVPGTAPSFGYQLTRDAAERVARNWWLLLLNGALLVVAGFLIFSIHWTVESLATFIGVLFIFQGISEALTTGIDARVSRLNVIAGLVSIAAGILLIAWPSPGLTALGIILGAWLVVAGTVAVSGALAASRMLPNWWLLLLLGLVEIALGVIAIANPGATLAALVTVGGIWAVAIGVTRIVLAFEVKRLPADVDAAWQSPSDGATGEPRTPRLAATGS